MQKQANPTYLKAITIRDPSDIHSIKEDIKKIGTSISGYDIYKFSYINEDTQYIGVMAQDVLLKKPEAVSKNSNGTFAVDYSQIDVEFREVA